MSGRDQLSSEDRRAPDSDAEPVLSEVARDDRDEGWGDEPGDSRRDAEWYRRERPPHHE